MPEPTAARGTTPAPLEPASPNGTAAFPTGPARHAGAPPATTDRPLLDEEVQAGSIAGQVTGATGQPPAPSKRRRKPRNILFWIALGWLGLVVFVAITADWLPIADPDATNIGDRLTPPFQDPTYPLGTDPLGRDTMSRLIYGARVSLIISVAAVTIGLVIGGTIGMVAGFFRGRLESVVMAVVDVILAFPALVLLLGVVAMIGQSLPAITVVIGFLSIPTYARVARGTTLAVAQREYVKAAQAMGAKNGRILFREILPNVIQPVLAFGLIALGIIIVLEGTLAFFGLSVEAPNATWGKGIAEGRRFLRDEPHVAAMPALAMFLTVLAVNFVGDQLRSRWDVKESAL